MDERVGPPLKFFIRIPATTWSSMYLYVPSKVGRLFKGAMPSFVYFRVRNGDIFEYGGGNQFEVLIISSTTTEICYPKIATFHSVSEDVVSTIAIEEPKVSVIGATLDDDIRAALLCSSRYGDGIDQFKICIARSCLQLPAVVVIPSEFNLFVDDSPRSILIFVHFLERGWEIRVERGPSHVVMTDGWLKFALDVGLEVGDLCVFQRRISRHGFIVGVYKDFTNIVLKHKEVEMSPRSFIKIADDAAVTEGDVVTKRLDTDQGNWAGWDWRSEGDLMVNGAFFVPSGQGLNNMYTMDSGAEPKSAAMIDQLTCAAGVLGGPRDNGDHISNIHGTNPNQNGGMTFGSGDGMGFGSGGMMFGSSTSSLSKTTDIFLTILSILILNTITSYAVVL